jgi:hypothetical protein
LVEDQLVTPSTSKTLIGNVLKQFSDLSQTFQLFQLIFCFTFITFLGPNQLFKMLLKIFVIFFQFENRFVRILEVAVVYNIG